VSEHARLKVGICPTCQCEIVAVLSGDSWVGDYCECCETTWIFAVVRTLRGAVSQAAEHIRAQAKRWSPEKLRAFVDERMAGAQHAALIDLAVHAGMLEQRDISSAGLAVDQHAREAQS